MYKITYNNGYKTWEGLSNSIKSNYISVIPAKSFSKREYIFSNEIKETILINSKYIYSIKKL